MRAMVALVIVLLVGWAWLNGAFASVIPPFPVAAKCMSAAWKTAP